MTRTCSKGEYVLIGPRPETPGPGIPYGEICVDGDIVATGIGGTLASDGTESGAVSIRMDVPVFEGLYNEWTDVCDKPRPNLGGDDSEEDGGETPMLATD